MSDLGGVDIVEEEMNKRIRTKVTENTYKMLIRLPMTDFIMCLDAVFQGHP